MVHIHSYFEVDWAATADNLKGMLQNKVSYSVLADALCVTTRTIYNWTTNGAHPKLEQLILLAKFLNVDLMDIVVTKGQKYCPLTKDDVSSALDKSRDAESAASSDMEHNSAASVCAAIIFNEYMKQSQPIQNLSELLLYLPLMDTYLLRDVLHRINGNLKQNQAYAIEQLGKLYRFIPDSPAKEYADQFRYFCLRNPSIYEISNDTKDQSKTEKIEQYLAWTVTESTRIAHSEYEKAYTTFLSKLSLYDELKALIERLDRDDNN